MTIQNLQEGKPSKHTESTLAVSLEKLLTLSDRQHAFLLGSTRVKFNFKLNKEKKLSVKRYSSHDMTK